MGGYPPHGIGPGGSPRPGEVMTDVAASTVEYEKKVGVHHDRSIESGGRVWANGNLHLVKSECGCAVYCNAITYGPVQGGGEESWITGGNTVVLIGGNRPVRGKVDGGDGSGGGPWWAGKREGGLIRKTPGCGTTATHKK